MEIAERNRKIKKVLSAAFGAGKVTVRGSRGTAYGWVSIKIDYRPRDSEERDALKTKIGELFSAAGITFGTYGYDDPGSDYGYGQKMNLDFGYLLDEFERGERVTWESGGKFGAIVEPNYRLPGWYMVQWDDAAPNTPEEFYKRDLKRIAPEPEQPAPVFPIKPRVRVKAGRLELPAVIPTPAATEENVTVH